MVVTADPYATEAAVEVLQNGGNAVDAAIAAQWVLNVVEPQSSGLGGGGFFLYYEQATKRLYAFDGRETAPAAAFSEMFLDPATGEPFPFKPERITGGLAVGVPGTLKLLKTVHDRFGSKKYSFAALFDPAIKLAEKGFPVSGRLAHFIDQEKKRLEIFSDSRRIFLDEKKEPRKTGFHLVQPELAATFREIRQNGIDSFYEGAIAHDMVDAVKNSPYRPGLLTADDLFYYKVQERQPVTGSYHGYHIVSMGPPSSGGTAVIEALQILEFYHLSAHGRTADGLHLFAEAQKLAFQDRNRLLGDPDFVSVPIERLISREYAKERAREIHFDDAIPTPEASVRPLHLEGTHTSHLSIVDEQGNLVAYTTTIEDIFGSALMVPGRGFFLNNELTDFDPVPRDTQGKLVPNAPGPKKRPRSSMSPTFVFQKDRPILIAGSPGGASIIPTVLNIVVNLIDFKMSAYDAVRAARVADKNGPLELEPGLFKNKKLRRDLERKGHLVTQSPVIGNAQVIFFDQKRRRFTGVSDPRGEGKAEGY